MAAKPPTKEGAVRFTHVPHPRDRIEALRKGRLASDDSRVTLAKWRFSGPTGAPGRWSSTIRMARELRLVSSSHTRPREHCVVPDGYARMAKAGLLGPDHNLVHGTSYTRADLNVVVDAGASLTSTVLVEPHIGDAQVAAFPRPAGCRRSASMSDRSVRADVPRDAGGALALRGNSAFKAMPVRARARRWNGRPSAARAPS